MYGTKSNIVILLLLAVQTLADTEKTPEKLAAIIERCKDANPLAVHFETNEIGTSKETVACYIKCLYQEIGLLNANFTANPPVFASLFKNKRLNENAIECLKKHPMQAATAEEICEISYKFYDCIRQKSPKILKRAIYLYYQTTPEEVENMTSMPKVKAEEASDTTSVEGTTTTGREESNSTTIRTTKLAHLT